MESNIKNSISVSIPNSGSVSGVQFRFGTLSDVKTGVAYDDADGDGVMDNNEALLEGIYVYLDTDGDNRPDLGEANTLTDETVSYTHLTLPTIYSV